MENYLDRNSCENNMTNMKWHENNMPWSGQMMEAMPPYMYGKCMNMCQSMPNMQVQCPYCGHMHMMEPHHCRGGNMYMYNKPMQTMEPIEHMHGKVYSILIMYVEQSTQKLVMENGGMMPKYISKERFNKEINEMIVKVTQRDEEIKKAVVMDRNENVENENTDRAMCPYCNGMLKSTLEILLITQLVNGGCAFCY